MLWPRSGVSWKIICVSIHEVAFRFLKISDCTAGSEAGSRPLSGCSGAKFEKVRGHSFSLHGPNLFIFFPISQTKKKKNSHKRTHASVTVTVVRDRKIGTALRTNQIVGFLTVPAWGCIKRPVREG